MSDFGGVPWSEWTELFHAVEASKEKTMRFTVQATRTFTTRRARTQSEWTRTEQVPTFWVEACSEENAESIARDVLGSTGEVALTATMAE